MAEARTTDVVVARATATNQNPAKEKPVKDARARKSDVGADDTGTLRKRRRFIWTCITAFLGTSFAMFLRFFFPRVLFEPSTVFTVGLPSDFGLGVETKFQEQD